MFTETCSGCHVSADPTSFEVTELPFLNGLTILEDGEVFHSHFSFIVYYISTIYTLHVVLHLSITFVSVITLPIVANGREAGVVGRHHHIMHMVVQLFNPYYFNMPTSL